MNGVHDMGGEQDMGPIRYEKDEPVFHAPWEGRVYAINRALGAWRKWTIDGSPSRDRAAKLAGRLFPDELLRAMALYERAIISIKTGLVTRAEVESGKPAPGSSKATPPVTAANAEAAALIRGSTRRLIAVTPRFAVGQHVRARNINPVGHTRLPAAMAHGPSPASSIAITAFSSSRTPPRHFLGEKPQHVYSVRFSARELWGEQAKPQDAVYLDMWDDYLEPV